MGICLGRFIQNLFLKSRYQSRNKLLKPVFAQFNTLGPSSAEEFTNTPNGSWRYSELVKSSPYDTTYFPTSTVEYAHAVFRGYMTFKNTSQGPLIHDNLGNTGYQILTTWVKSSTNQTLRLVFNGDDGHTLFVDGEFMGGNGFSIATSNSVPLLANVPRKLELAIYNSLGGWAGYIGFGPWIGYVHDNWSNLLEKTQGLLINADGFSQPYNNISTNPNPALLVWIPAGTFVMGSPTNEAERNSDETQHTVTFTRGFFMSKYLVRQGDYLSVMGRNPSQFTGNTNFPVEKVSWIDATNYCAKLTQREQAAGRLPSGWVYRLPTESEWEYACRAGTTTAFYFGNAIRGGQANFDSYYEYDSTNGTITTNNARVGYICRTSPVGSYAPNPWGLYDMCGNVLEWCQYWYGPYPTGNGSVIDSVAPATDSNRVLRGGSWASLGRDCRSAFRHHDSPNGRSYFVGFRPILAPGQL